MNKALSASADKEKNLLLCAVKGISISVLTAISAAVVSCLIALSLPDPDKYIKIFAVISLLLAAGIGGHMTARERGKNTLFCGLSIGISITALMSVISLSLSLELNMPLFCICVPCIIVTSVLGAVTGVDKGKKRRTKRKKRKGR